MKVEDPDNLVGQEYERCRREFMRTPRHVVYVGWGLFLLALVVLVLALLGQT